MRGRDVGSLQDSRVQGVDMLMDVLLSFGLLLSTASQLRPPGLPVGPGEICLAAWVFLMLFREAGRVGPPMSRPLVVMLMFWLVFAVAQSIGTMTGYAIGDRHDHELFMHDVLAYPLLAAVSCLCVVEPGAGLRLRRTAWLVVALGAVFLSVQVGNAWGVFDIAAIDPWYWDRFRGWSANPNQLALLCAVLGLLSLYLAEAATRFGEGIAAMACGVVAIYVGRLSKSDTFVLVLVGSVPIFVALKFRSWLAARQDRLTFRSAFAWIVILAAPVGVPVVVPLLNSIAVEAGEVAREVAKGNTAETERTASVRVNAWKDAVDRGIESGLLGLGPGPHLEIPFLIAEARQQSTDEPKYLEHPQLNFTPNFEAHNTLLDLFTQCGLIGVLSVLWLGAMGLLATYRAKLDGLTTLLCGLAIFSIFHLIIRHPIFWFAIALCLVAGDAARPPPAARIWS